jgi:hypothetical protein
MTTSKPVELGTASEETKGVGIDKPDSEFVPHGDFPL